MPERWAVKGGAGAAAACPFGRWMGQRSLPHARRHRMGGRVPHPYAQHYKAERPGLATVRLNRRHSDGVSSLAHTSQRTEGWVPNPVRSRIGLRSKGNHLSAATQGREIGPRVSHTERADGFVTHPYTHLHRAEAVSSLTYARLHKVEGLCPCLRVAHHTPENQGSLSIV